MVSRLHIHLLGEFRLFAGDRPVYTLKQPRLQALLTYLLLHRHTPQPRPQMAFRFWPDTPETQAKTNLRKLYFQLRQALPAAELFLYADTQHLGWRQEAPYTLDVGELEESLNELGRAAIPDVKRVEQVIALYRGELLPTCDDEWIFPMRQALHVRVVNCLATAVTGLEDQRQYAAGIECAEYLLHLDPLHEETYRRLMRLRALSGDRAGALRVYHACVQVLEEELAAPPAAETQAVHDWLLKADLQPSPPSSTLTPLADEAPLVGRQAEWHVLQQAWRTGSRQPHFVLIWGEAGMGKSRLAEELMRWSRPRMGTLARSRAYAAKGALAYAPVADWLRTEALRPALAKLEDVWLGELARLLPEILVERPSLPPPAPLAEAWQRQRFFEALTRAMVVASRPLLLVLDDMQWCDAETLAWLRYLLSANPPVPLLVVGAARIEEVDEQHPLHELRWYLQREGKCSEITLSPLNLSETAMLIEHLAGQEATGWTEYLYQETEGNPLFVVETVRAQLLAAIGETREAYPSSPPPTVQAVIAARLAQLSAPARQLAQLAATIGRAFTMEVLAEAGAENEERLVEALDELWQRRIVREQRQGYDFSHDKIREASYGAISRGRRQYLHRKVAQALEKLYAARLDDISGQLAVHYEQSGQVEQAIAFYRRAAEVARRLYANTEAIDYIQRSLRLLESAPKTSARWEQEFALQALLGLVVSLSRGYASPECAQAYHRALALGQQLGKTSELSGVRYTLWRYHFTRSEFSTAQALAEALLEQALRTDHRALRSYAQHALGATFLYAGKVALAHDYLLQSLATDDRDEPDETLLQLQHPRVVSTSYDAFALWYLGYPDQATHRCRQALALAHALGRPINQASAYMMAAWVHQCRGEPQLVEAHAEAGLDLSHQYDLLYWKVVGMLLRDWSLVAQGRAENPLAQMRNSVQHFQASGAALYLPYYLGLLTDACRMLGHISEGLHTVYEALAIVESRDERQWEPELHRLRGELLQAQGSSADEVEQAFSRAIEIAQHQQAKSLELRAALSLSRFWHAQGQRAQAQRLLTGIYTWFQEGSETCDVIAAQALLEEVG